MFYFILYLIVVNLAAIVITAHDKLAAIRHRRRTPEAVLMAIAAVGGSPAMFITMLVIRHKTRKPLFMIGIPLIFILELALVLYLHHVGIII